MPGELRVIAGDMEGDSIGAWVKTLLSDAFYWTDNDLVVQTRSMYGGAPRAAERRARFLLDKGGKVTHFNYFTNRPPVQAIDDARCSRTAPADFAAIGPLSWAGEDASGRAPRAPALARRAAPTPRARAERPAVFVLPGILGIEPEEDGQARSGSACASSTACNRSAGTRPTAASVEPDGPIGAVYADLIERLAETHEVIAFAFDWRRPVEDEARRLGEQSTPRSPRARQPAAGADRRPLDGRSGRARRWRSSSPTPGSG